MKPLAWAAAAVLGSGLIVAETAMDLTPADRQKLYLVFGGLTLVTFLAGLVALRAAPRFRSLRVSLRVVALAAVAITGVVVAVSAITMLLDRHDLTVIMIALLLGVGLGGVMAAAVGSSLTKDLAALSAAAAQAGTGNLTARSGIRRGDELGKAAKAFDEMVHRLESAEAERRTLLAALSHDLRTPLASMQAAVEALQDGIAPNPPGYLRGIANDIAHLNGLVDDLFVLARIETGRLALSLTEIDLAELADEAVEAVTPTAAKRKIQLAVQTPGRVGVVGDAAALGRVFRNLLVNAVRHSPEFGEVQVRLTTSGPLAHAVVVDQGEGFAGELRQRAFDPFVRADQSRSRDSGGSGLGLAIAKGIVESHGGSIEIENGPGGRVGFSLPVSVR